MVGIPENSRETFGSQEGSVLVFFLFFFLFFFFLPKHDAISNSTEEIIGVRIHRDDVPAIRVIFQGFVYPVDKGILLFLCK